MHRFFFLLLQESLFGPMSCLPSCQLTQPYYSLTHLLTSYGPGTNRNLLLFLNTAFFELVRLALTSVRRGQLRWPAIDLGYIIRPFHCNLGLV